MGESRSRREGNRTIMKTLLFVAASLAMALAAPQETAESGPNANAEADPYYGYARPYGYYGYYGKRSADEAAPAASGPSADAEPAAEPVHFEEGIFAIRVEFFHIVFNCF